MSSVKSTMIIAAIFVAAAFAGIAVIGDDADAEDSSSAITSIAYKVGENTFVIPLTEAERTAGAVTLKTLAELGATADAGMAFKCWTNNTTNYTAGSTFVVTGLTEPVELVADFTPVVYTATFVDHDGKEISKVTGSIRDPTGATITAVKLTAQAPADPTREGYIFAGWMTAGAETAVKKSSLPDLTADVTYTATYVVDHLITFVDGDKTYQSHVSDLTVPDLGTRVGFNFLGWFDDKGIQVLDPKTAAYDADATLTAKWEPINVYVTFIAGSYSKEVAVLYGETVIEPALPDGYERWDFDFTVPITEDVTVKAVAVAEEAKDPSSSLVLIIAGFLACVVLAIIVIKRKEISAGLVKLLGGKKE